MPTLDLKNFSQACRDLFSAGLKNETFVERSFKFLAALVPADLIVYGNLLVNEQRLEIESSHPHPGFHHAMSNLGKMMDRYPLFSWDPSVNGGKPVRRSDYYSNSQFRNLDVYHEVFRPLGIDNHCAVHIPTTKDQIIFFGLERNGGPDYTDKELFLLEAAQTQLSSAHAIARTRAQPDTDSISIERLCKAGLTPRQAETLHWICQGKSNQEIATLMNIRLYTVKDHITSIFNKTGVDNRFSAIVWARHICLTESRPPRKLATIPLRSGMVSDG